MTTSSTAGRRAGATLAAGALALVGAAALGQPASAAASNRSFDYTCRSTDGSITDRWTVEAATGSDPRVVAGEPIFLDITHVGATSSPVTADALRTRYHPVDYEARKRFEFSLGDGKPSVSEITDDDLYEFPEPGGSVRSNAYDGKTSSPTAPERPGRYAFTVGALRIDLTLNTPSGSTNVTFNCTPPQGEAAQMYSIDVVAPDTPTTSGPSSSGNESPSGPSVETGVHAEGSNSRVIALGALLLAGAVAVGAATRGRLD